MSDHSAPTDLEKIAHQQKFIGHCLAWRSEPEPSLGALRTMLCTQEEWQQKAALSLLETRDELREDQALLRALFPLTSLGRSVYLHHEYAVERRAEALELWFLLRQKGFRKLILAVVESHGFEEVFAEFEGPMRSVKFARRREAFVMLQAINDPRIVPLLLDAWRREKSYPLKLAFSGVLEKVLIWRTLPKRTKLPVWTLSKEEALSLSWELLWAQKKPDYTYAEEPAWLRSVEFFHDVSPEAQELWQMRLWKFWRESTSPFLEQCIFFGLWMLKDDAFFASFVEALAGSCTSKIEHWHWSLLSRLLAERADEAPAALAVSLLDTFQTGICATERLAIAQCLVRLGEQSIIPLLFAALEEDLLNMLLSSRTHIVSRYPALIAQLQDREFATLLCESLEESEESIARFGYEGIASTESCYRALARYELDTLPSSSLQSLRKLRDAGSDVPGENKKLAAWVLFCTTSRPDDDNAQIVALFDSWCDALKNTVERLGRLQFVEIEARLQDMILTLERVKARDLLLALSKAERDSWTQLFVSLDARLSKAYAAWRALHLEPSLICLLRGDALRLRTLAMSLIPDPVGIIDVHVKERHEDVLFQGS